MIFDTTVILLVLLVLVMAALIYVVFLATKTPRKDDYLDEDVRPLVGVVMPNERKKGRK